MVEKPDFMKAFRMGKERVFRKLYEEFYTALCMYGFRLTGDEQAAGDHAQEAFIRLWENREHFDTYPSIRAYLYTLVRNAALNQLKHEKMKNERREELKPEETEDSVLEELIRQEAERQLSQLIRVLSPECRRVIHLLAEGKSYKEVGELLHISPNTVKNHRVKALKILRKICRMVCLFWM